MKFLTLLAAFALVAVAAAQPATNRAQLLRIHQVTREEYDALLKLAKGKSTLSEARLIHSPLTGIKALAVKGIGLFAAGSHLNKNGYNLCTSEKRSLYFTEKVDEDDSDEHEHGGHNKLVKAQVSTPRKQSKH
ncbi:uncharacterized protein LOC108594785 [Drosophila busckii]|uniref:uncharacterized protein LOC108594785 n=1 Tax=Drosophila busckii TaxID=30019 RepID=UPI001432867E|nr:uncharacterized protein LOC108594785 [Drosophila busckii]